jgi:hypothetical protein
VTPAPNPVLPRKISPPVAPVAQVVPHAEGTSTVIPVDIPAPMLGQTTLAPNYSQNRWPWYLFVLLLAAAATAELARRHRKRQKASEE